MVLANPEFVQLTVPATIPGVQLMHARFRDQYFLPHSHSHLTVTVIGDGAWQANQGGGPVTAGKGQINVVNCGEVHEGGPADARGCTLREYALPVPMLRRLARRVTGNGGGLPRFETPVIDDPDLAGRLWELHRRLEDQPEAGPLRTGLRESLETLLEAHVAEYVPPRADIPEHPGVRRAVRFIRNRYADAIELADIAAAAGLSRFYLIRIFQTETGVTPHVYLTQTRLEWARELLRAGHPLAGTATACGFIDQSHFTHRFRQFYGYTPGRYMQACRPA